MKLITFLLFAGTLGLSATSYSQSKKIDLEVYDSPIITCLVGIEEGTEFLFLYDESAVNLNSKRTLIAKSENIEVILNQLFEGTDIAYLIDDRQIFLFRREKRDIPDKVKIDLSGLNDLKRDQQNKRTISGQVKGPNGAPLAGVTVMVKESSLGTITNADGRFSLEVTSTSKTLVFSFIGMESREIDITSENVLNIVMSESTLDLGEVVVIGYGTQKKISVTGAVVSVGNDILVKSPSASISNTLAGRVTGLSTVQYSGQPGADEARMYVRGIGSLTEGASAPLVLVDGVERPFSQLDPNEVESISVLKDASATAVYGIRGANGVIIVTTKRGVVGKPKISFTATSGFQMPTDIVRTTDSYEYALKYNEALLNDNPSLTPEELRFSPEAIEAFRTHSNPLIYPSVDWMDEILKPVAFQTQENINISGGTPFVKYFVSLGYLFQDGQTRTFDVPYGYGYNFSRYNYRANVDMNVTKTTTLSLTMGGRNEIRQDPAGKTGDGVFRVLYWCLPYSGQLYQGDYVRNTDRYLPNATAVDGYGAIGYGTGYNRQYANPLNLDLGLTQKLDFITKGLSWRAKVSQNTTSVYSKKLLTSPEVYYAIYQRDVDPTIPPSDNTVVLRGQGLPSLPSYSEPGSGKSRNWYMETAFAYDHQFGSHNLTGLILYNQSKTYYPPVYTDIPTGYVGIAARATYNYKAKYLLDLNLGYNGSENFAPGKRFGLFPAIALGWVITEENFLKNKISFLQYLKLRFSYGVVGNDYLSGQRFMYLPDTYIANAGGPADISHWEGLLPAGYSWGTINPTYHIAAEEGVLGNPDVTWEKAKKQNYGIDLKLFDGKLGLSADYFSERRSNILTTKNIVPTILAISLPAVNIGKVENHGFEVELKWTGSTGSLNYFIGSNVSYARNKIIFMDEVPKNEPYLLETGRRVGERFAYVFDGFWSAEDITHLEDYPDHNYIPKPGDVRYKDLNGDNIIDPDDRQPTGFPDYPEYVFSLSGGADFKGFDLSFMFTGATNVSREMGDSRRYAFGATADRALLQWISDNAWTPETANTAILPRMTISGKGNNTKLSSVWLKDASYIRLKNVEIGYSFSPAIIKRLGISKTRIFANAYNLLTFDKLDFIDPESQTGEMSEYPVIKIINLGITVDF